jgi:hypothetical protein
MGLLDRLLQLDRRWIFLLVLLAILVPTIFPIGLPVSTSKETRAAFEYVESLQPGDIVWLSIDYGPSSEPENNPMAEAFLRQCFLKKIRVIVTALYPLGGLSIANDIVARVTAEFPDLRYGVDYVNLGYKEGASAVMRRLGQNIETAFPVDVNRKPIGQIPMMEGLRNIGQVKLVFTVATGVIGEYWITLVNAQFGTPVIIGPTAVSAPKYYAYLNAGQAKGMLGGMKGASEYEHLLRDAHPEMDAFYRTTRGFTAMRGMYGQTVIHALMLVFIVLGNAAYLRGRAAGRRGGA